MGGQERTWDGMIGSERDARNAAIVHFWGRDLPPGWSFLDRGEHRTAYLSPGGVVYKVGSNDVNAREASNLDYLAQVIGDHLPAYQLYTVTMPHPDDVVDDDDARFYVMAMEYVEADGTEADFGLVLQAAAEAGVLDLNPANWIVRAGRAMLVDAGGI